MATFGSGMPQVHSGIRAINQTIANKNYSLQSAGAMKTAKLPRPMRRRNLKPGMTSTAQGLMKKVGKL